MSLEILCWIGAAALVIGAWKLISCLVHMAFSPLRLCSPDPDITRDLQLKIRKLRDERARLEEEISQLNQGLCKSSGMSHDIPFPCDVVYVCSKGSCFHTDPQCCYLRDRSTHGLQLCKLCSKKGSKKSFWLCTGDSSDVKWCHCIISGCCCVDSCPQYRILGQFQYVSASCVKTIVGWNLDFVTMRYQEHLWAHISTYQHYIALWYFMILCESLWYIMIFYDAVWISMIYDDALCCIYMYLCLSIS